MVVDCFTKKVQRKTETQIKIYFSWMFFLLQMFVRWSNLTSTEWYIIVLLSNFFQSFLKKWPFEKGNLSFEKQECAYYPQGKFKTF